LKHTSKETYYPRGPNINQVWDHTHRPPATAGAGGGPGQPQPLRDAYVAGDLADAMRKDPRLKVLSVNGLFDLATPFFITEYDLAHIELAPKLRQNIEFRYYPSGPHDLSERGRAEAVEDRSGRLLRSRRGGLPLTGFQAP
jgi:carboxypeptidase C (cathepsin A)